MLATGDDGSTQTENFRSRSPTRTWTRCSADGEPDAGDLVDAFELGDVSGTWISSARVSRA